MEKVMYKTVYDLTNEQITELKEAFFWQCMTEDEDILGDISYSWEIPDNVIYNHYSGITFVDDDFCCSAAAI